MAELVSNLTGQVLIAMPGIGDERFERSVIFVCAHNDEHAMGLTVNRPLEGLTMPSLLAKLGIASDLTMPEDLVLLGGPVERERGFVLHTSDYASQPGTLSIDSDLALTATREVLEAMADQHRRPRKSVLALGYAGWGGGQLESELRQNVWLTCPPDEDLLFGVDHDRKWEAALAKIGVSAARLSSHSGRA